MRDETRDNDDLDVITIGRSSVDLYGEQVGGRLEDMTSFAKYIGGCPTNIAAGAARLGLRAAVITRVGDEHMGRFIREQLQREAVDTRFVITDKERLTALVILGIRDDHTFPLIFYRENCADMALSEQDIDEDFIASARAIVVSGTHFSKPNVEAASRKAIRLARAHGVRVVFDIDYRPVLWGLTGHGLGEERFVAAAAVTERLLSIVPDCDLIVGTEEEFHIAGGTTDTIAALRAVRARTNALLLCKCGALGCAAFPGAIPDTLDDGVRGEGFPVEVFNVLGAGDAFMSGLLRGWLRDEPLAECCRYANACGAFAVSRHGCTPAVPTWPELQHFLTKGSPTRRLREDSTLNQLHWSTTRTGDWPLVQALAFDHRVQFEAIAEECGAEPARIGTFKLLVLQAVQRIAQSAKTRSALGILADGRFGKQALDRATGSGLWIGRPIELPLSRPLRFEGGADVGTVLREWPAEHVVKCLVSYHPEDPLPLRDEQERQLITLFEACRRTSHELLIEVIPPRDLPCDDRTLPAAIERFYGLGIYPDWWKLPTLTESQAAWDGIDAVIQRHDPRCRGVLLLGLDAPIDTLKASLRLAARQPICKGFAVGRTIFGAAAHDWFANQIGDDEAVQRMAAIFGDLIECWNDERA
ncbi:MAG: 5-dehydro-2-deoxygluconokinase [Azospirillaceae bacterium]|nr:5-dehydro-2-deoxygluconokinase [Azospirillaceae bacterium]